MERVRRAFSAGFAGLCTARLGACVAGVSTAGQVDSIAGPSFGEAAFSIERFRTTQ